MEIKRTMNRSNVTERKEEIGSQIWLVVYRMPKKNHDAMVLNWKQVNDLFRKHVLLSLFQ